MADIPESTKMLPTDKWGENAYQRLLDHAVNGTMPPQFRKDLHDILDIVARTAPPAMDREAVESQEAISDAVHAELWKADASVQHLAQTLRFLLDSARDYLADAPVGNAVHFAIEQADLGLSTLSADAIRQGEGGWKAELRDFASLMVDEVIARTKIQLEAGEGLSVADQLLMLEQLIVERKRHALATPASHASDGGKA